MTITTLDKAIDEVREQAPETQEVLARFLRSVIAERDVGLGDIEQQVRDEHTRAALESIERGEFVSLDQAKREMTEFLSKSSA